MVPQQWHGLISGFVILSSSTSERQMRHTGRDLTEHSGWQLRLCTSSTSSSDRRCTRLLLSARLRGVYRWNLAPRSSGLWFYWRFN